MRYTLRQLTFLIETARRGGIAPAARHLNISAAAISAALDKLEAMTGLVLFDRFPAQGMQLTRAGVDFLVEAERLVSQAEALDRYASELAEGKAGAIHIGTHYAIAQRIVLPAVIALRESHPGVRIEVVEADVPSLVGGLQEGELDALVSFDHGIDPALFDVEILMSLPPYVLLSSAHPLATKKSVSLSDLAGMPYIAVSNRGTEPSYLQLLQAAGLQPEVPFTSLSRELVEAYVGKGLGFTLAGFPPKLDRSIEGDPLTALQLDEQIGHFNAVIARSRYKKQDALVETFLDLCRSTG